PALRGGRIFDKLAVEVATKCTEGCAELDRPSRSIGAPERHLAGLTGRWTNDHAIARDVFDSPGRRTEDERLAFATFGDHLFVELADLRAALSDVHAEQTAIGNRAARHDR